MHAYSYDKILVVQFCLIEYKNYLLRTFPLVSFLLHPKAAMCIPSGGNRVELVVFFHKNSAGPPVRIYRVNLLKCSMTSLSSHRYIQIQICMAVPSDGSLGQRPFRTLETSFSRYSGRSLIKNCG